MDNKRMYKKWVIVIVLMICNHYSLQAQSPSKKYFNIDPTKYNEGFTYLVFPFNTVFVKSKKIKTISYTSDYNGTNFNERKEFYEFNSEGNLIKEYMVKITSASQKDTIVYKEYVYNTNTNLLDTVFTFESANKATEVSCYHYDDQKRLQKILNFSLTELQKIDTSLLLTDGDMALLPPGIPMNDNEEFIDKTCIKGRPLNLSVLYIMKKDNDFNSLHYTYSQKDGFDVRLETTLYDFSKKYNKVDTFQGNIAYYSYKNRVVQKWTQASSMKQLFPREMYKYKGVLLDSINEYRYYRPRNTAFQYDKKNNLIGLSNIWQGKKVSDLEMIYDKRGFLVTIIRKSQSNLKEYFMDATVNFEYEYY